MTELKFFRLLLVTVAALLLATGGGWGWLHTRQRAAEAAVDASFSEYNRYIAACGDAGSASVAWDLATRSYDALARASAARDRYAGMADTLLAVGAISVVVLVLAFYALRWALTGRVRPLWLLGQADRGSASLRD
jgi:hypothetical protein